MDYEEALLQVTDVLKAHNRYHMNAPDHGKAVNAIRDIVTPKGSWEIVDADSLRILNCVCTECGHDPQEYIGGTEDWWLRKTYLPNFCPNCGVRIVNVKGGAE